ncbi:hypothetical protein PIB30_080018 [Stylosanthes scabra]|uniref:Secreted protein n=1 Tax=Stylosanthes scabra TaxID=79078 RepID=A0ABU6VUU3_9FABA|nr:hypothetical protein [Stylosanthes scabra]
MLLRAAAIVVLLLCCAKESSPDMSCFSSNPSAAMESGFPLLSEMVCFCFPQDFIVGAASHPIVPTASPWASPTLNQPLALPICLFSLFLSMAPDPTLGSSLPPNPSGTW